MRKNLLFFMVVLSFFGFRASGQDKLVTGKVIDDTGSSVPGVICFN